MSFFNPLNLLWLLPLAGTVILLYVLRPRRLKFEVPSLFLWNAISTSVRSDTPFQKLKVSALLLLQLLALFLLIFVLAHPFSTPRPISKAVYIIVLDQSVGMEATDVKPSRFAVAQLAAEEFLRNNLRSGDTASVIGSGVGPSVLCEQTSDRAKLLDAISAAQPTDAPSTLDSTITFVAGAQHGATAIVLFSCGNGSEDDDGDLIRRAGAPLMAVTVGTTDPVNAGIVNISERTDAIHPDSPPQLLVAVSRQNSSSGDLTVSLNGKPFAAAGIPGGGGTLTKIFTLDGLRKGGIVTAHLTGFSRDDLMADNTSSLVLSPTSAKRLLLVTDGDPYLERALSLLPDVRLYEVKPANYVDSSGQFDATVFDGWLPTLAPAGPLLVFNAINSQMPVITTGKPLIGPRIVDWDESDPLLSYVDLSAIHIAAALPAKTTTWGIEVAELAQSPVIVRGDLAGRSIVWVGFAPAGSDLPMTPSFPIFLANAIQFLTTGASDVVQDRPTGTPFLLPPVDGTWSVTDPAGESSNVACTLTGGCEYAQTAIAGLYRARFGDRQQIFACNVAGSAAADIAVKPHPLLTSTGASRLERATQRLSLAPWLIAAGLVVVLFEWLVYNRPARYTRPI